MVTITSNSIALAALDGCIGEIFHDVSNADIPHEIRRIFRAFHCHSTKVCFVAFCVRPPSFQDRVLLHRPMMCGVSEFCNCLQQFVATVLLVVQPMGTARKSMILHVCNCLSSCSQNFSLFVFTLIGSQSLLKAFANLNSYLVTHSVSNPSDSLSNSPNFAVLLRRILRASPTNGSRWGFASTCASIRTMIVSRDLVFLHVLLHVLVNFLQHLAVLSQVCFSSPQYAASISRILSGTTRQ